MFAKKSCSLLHETTVLHSQCPTLPPWLLVPVRDGLVRAQRMDPLELEVDCIPPRKS